MLVTLSLMILSAEFHIFYKVYLKQKSDLMMEKIVKAFQFPPN